MAADLAAVRRGAGAALAREGAQRAAFLRDACAGDLALQREVEALLARDDAAESFLERPSEFESGDSGLDLIGQQIGLYKVMSLLGAGGMGEVYRARDTKLGRDVALKVLPARFTADRDRLARFEREARMLATLNHPHIGAIYGFETTGSVGALVLEAAHEKGIIHRDLKPANSAVFPRLPLGGVQEN